MTNDIEALPGGPSKSRRMLQSDVRPMERCCGHHLFAHDADGCLITGCICHEHVISAGVFDRKAPNDLLDELDDA